MTKIAKYTWESQALKGAEESLPDYLISNLAPNER
jgi:hypothetical protein